MENDESAQHRYGSAINLLSYLSAAWCAIAIIVVATLLISSAGSQVLEALAHPGANIAEFAGELCGLGLASVFIVLVSGLALGRFVLRALPPRFLEGPRPGWFGTIRAIVLCIFLGGLLVPGVSVFLVASRIDAATSKPLDETALASIGASAVLAMICTCCAIGPLILRHWKPRAFLDRPFVLFLRRFSTFSDRTVIALVLKQAPSGVPVVFLTPRLSRPGDWDPFVVGFVGLKVLHPWKSVPIVLRASDDDWRPAADELIRRAQTILLDTSETSSALRTEVEMIDNANRWSDTVCLRLLARNAGPGEDSLGYPLRARIIDYRKSWVRALPRMVIGLVIVQLTSVFLSIPLSVLTPGFMHPLALILILIAATSAYYSVFVRPTINREAKLSLKTALQAGS
jgi:hypothetical protein